MNKTTILILAAGFALLAVVAGCASMDAAPSPAEINAATQAALKTSFTDKGQAKLDRLVQDDLQKACSEATPPAPEVAAKLAEAQAATLKWPSNGVYLGDWKVGEKLAQDGKGKTWKDDPKKADGGNCYNCHQITKAEISFGTIGPSLYQYGKLRGVTDPNSPEAQAIIKYTWGKLWNAKATNACSVMPRFGHEALLDEGQLRDIMALLLDPKSPVNAD